MSSLRARVGDAEIRNMVEVFYDRVRHDPDLGPVFERRIGRAWPEHLDRMVDFWASVLLGARRFHGDPVARHRAIGELHPAHFDRWLELFAEVLDETFPEYVAADIMGRARRMRVALDPGPFPDAITPPDASSHHEGNTMSMTSETGPGAFASGRTGGRRRSVGLALAGLLMVALPLAAQTAPEPSFRFDENGSPLDPIAILQKRIDAGETVLQFNDQHGYLEAVLAALEIPASSQGLIFSRSSLQTNLITPWTPRAVYYNDDVYVGWVQDSQILEIASIDPDDGGVFYTLAQNPEGDLKFMEEGTTCLMCHESRSVTDGVPGVMVRSVVVDRFGYPIAPLHEGSTSDRTPFDRRFAGWYVTGTHQGGPHAGNAYAPVLSHEVTDLARYLEEFDVNADGNVTDLEGRFDIEPYLTRHSDIVSLMVLTHQTRVHNLVTVAHEAAKEAVGGADILAQIRSGAMPVPEIQSAAQVRIDGAVERLVRAMMFSREAPLPGRVEGTTAFQDEFEARGPFDAEGRSLRQFDLERRLFRYPMSFLVYSEAFVVLPDFVKAAFYRRVAEILDGLDQSGEFEHLNASDRAAIREILVATKPEFQEMLARPAR